MSWLECVATAFNLVANAVLARRLCEDALSPVPRSVLAVQAAANVCWCTHAAWREDLPLFVTAGASLCLQASSLVATASRRSEEEEEEKRWLEGGERGRIQGVPSVASTM